MSVNTPAPKPVRLPPCPLEKRKPPAAPANRDIMVRHGWVEIILFVLVLLGMFMLGWVLNGLRIERYDGNVFQVPAITIGTDPVTGHAKMETRMLRHEQDHYDFWYERSKARWPSGYPSMTNDYRIVTNQVTIGGVEFDVYELAEEGDE